jgi:hypothetical protein
MLIEAQAHTGMGVSKTFYVLRLGDDAAVQ